MEAVQEYTYRKEFGLSAQEFYNEPWDVYIINLKIINSIADIQRRETKKANRKR